MIVGRLEQMRATLSLMYGDISHLLKVLDLSKRTKTICVVSSHHLADPGDGQEEQPMDVCIQYCCYPYAKDMLHQCGLTDEDGNPVAKLPHVLGVSALLNAMLGGMYNDLLLRMTSNELKREVLCCMCVQVN
jgi:hypothetical protein